MALTGLTRKLDAHSMLNFAAAGGKSPASAIQTQREDGSFTLAGRLKNANDMLKKGDGAGAQNELSQISRHIKDPSSAYYKPYYLGVNAGKGGDEAFTRGMENDLNSMRATVSDMVDKGYSDKDIVAKVNGTQYSFLGQAVQEMSATGARALTRPVDYIGDDTVYAQIEQKRSGKQGDVMSALADYCSKDGSAPDPYSEASYDPQSEYYNPYAHGSTYFGQGDEAKARANSENAARELEELNAWAKDMLAQGLTPEQVYVYLGTTEQGANTTFLQQYCPTLWAMEEARENGTALELYDAVDFALPYYYAQLKQMSQNGEEPFEIYTPTETGIPVFHAQPQQEIPPNEFAVKLSRYMSGFDTDDETILNFRAQYPELFGQSEENEIASYRDKLDFESEYKNRLAEHYGMSVDYSDALTIKNNRLGDDFYKNVLDPARKLFSGGAIDAQQYSRLVQNMASLIDYADAQGSSVDKLYEKGDSYIVEQVDSMAGEVQSLSENSERMTAMNRLAASEHYVQAMSKALNHEELSPTEQMIFDSINDQDISAAKDTDEGYKKALDGLTDFAWNYMRDTQFGGEGAQYQTTRAVSADAADYIDSIMKMAAALGVDFDSALEYMDVDIDTLYKNAVNESLAEYERGYNEVADAVHSIFTEDALGDVGGEALALGDFGDNLRAAFESEYGYDPASLGEDLGVPTEEITDELLRDEYGWTDEEIAQYNKYKTLRDMYAQLDGSSAARTNLLETLKEYGMDGDEGLKSTFGALVADEAERNRELELMGENRPETVDEGTKSWNPFFTLWGGIKKGTLIHAQGWLKTAYFVTRRDYATQERDLRYEIADPQQMREAFQGYIDKLDNENLKSRWQNELDNYTGDIFSFKFSVDGIGLQDAIADVGDAVAAWDATLRERLPEWEIDVVNGVASGWNSTLLVYEALPISALLTAAGCPEGVAGVIALGLTMGANEGYGEMGNEILDAGGSKGEAVAKGTSYAALTAVVENGMDGVTRRILRTGGMASSAYGTHYKTEALGKWLYGKGHPRLASLAQFALNTASDTFIGTLKDIPKETVQELIESEMKNLVRYATPGAPFAGAFRQTAEDVWQTVKDTAISTLFQSTASGAGGKTVQAMVNRTGQQSRRASTHLAQDLLQAEGEYQEQKTALENMSAEDYAAREMTDEQLAEQARATREYLDEQSRKAEEAELAFDLMKDELKDINANEGENYRQSQQKLDRTGEALKQAQSAAQETGKIASDLQNELMAEEIPPKELSQQYTKAHNNAQKAQNRAAALQAEFDTLSAETDRLKQAMDKRSNDVYNRAHQQARELQAQRQQERLVLLEQARREELRKLERYHSAQISQMISDAANTPLTDRRGRVITDEDGNLVTVRPWNITQAYLAFDQVDKEAFRNYAQTVVKEKQAVADMFRQAWQDYDVRFDDVEEASIDHSKKTMVLPVGASLSEIVNRVTAEEIVDMAENYGGSAFTDYANALMAELYGDTDGRERLQNDLNEIKQRRAVNDYKALRQLLIEKTGDILLGSGGKMDWFSYIRNNNSFFAKDVRDWIALRRMNLDGVVSELGQSIDAKDIAARFGLLREKFSQAVGASMESRQQTDLSGVEAMRDAILGGESIRTEDFDPGLLEIYNQLGTQFGSVFSDPNLTEEERAAFTAQFEKLGMDITDASNTGRSADDVMQGEAYTALQQMYADYEAKHTQTAPAQNAREAVDAMENGDSVNVDAELPPLVQDENGDYTLPEGVDESSLDPTAAQIVDEVTAQYAATHDESVIDRYNSAAMENAANGNGEPSFIRRMYEGAKDALSGAWDNAMSRYASESLDKKTYSTLAGRVYGKVMSRLYRAGSATFNTPRNITRLLANEVGTHIYENVTVNNSVVRDSVYDKHSNAVFRGRSDQSNEIINSLTGISNALQKQMPFTVSKQGLGFNDFFIAYMTRSDEQLKELGLADEAGRYTDFLGEKRMGQDVIKRRDQLRDWVYNSNAEKRLSSFIRRFGDTFKDPLASVRDFSGKFRTAMLDSANATRFFDRYVSEATGAETNELSTAAHRRPYMGKTAENWVSGTPTDLDGNPTGDKSFHQVIADAKLGPKDRAKAAQYLALRSMIDWYELDKDPFDPSSMMNLERDDNLMPPGQTFTLSDKIREAFAGMAPTREDVEARIAEIEKEFGQGGKDIRRFSENWYAAWDGFMRNVSLAEGLVTPETYQRIKKAHPHYAPLNRTEDITGVFYAQGGSNEKIIDPIDSFLKKIEYYTQTAAKNRVLQHFDDMFTRTPNMGMWATRIDPKSLDEGTDLIKGENTITVKRKDGTAVYYTIADKQLLDFFKHMDYTQRGADWASSRILTGLQRLTRTQAMMHTAANFIFNVGRNPIRDIQTSINHGSWSTGASTGVGLLTAIAKWTNSLTDVAKEELWGKGSEVAKQYKNMGGFGYTQAGSKVKRVKAQNQELFGESVPKRIAKFPLKLMTMETMAGIIETASRFAEFKFGMVNTGTAQGAGGKFSRKLYNATTGLAHKDARNAQVTQEALDRAFMNSREVTVDFSRGGNSAVVALMKAAVPFANPTVQGLDRAWRTVAHAEERDRLLPRMVKSFVNNGIMAAASTALMMGVFKSNPDEDDEEMKQGYLDLDDDLKRNNIMFPWFNGVDREVWRLPISQDPMDRILFGSMRKIFEEIWTGENTDLNHDPIITDIIKTVYGATLGEVLDMRASFAPIWDVMKNKDYYGSPIISSSQDKKGIAPLTQFKDTTPELYKKSAALIYGALGWIPGIKDTGFFRKATSPIVHQYLAEQYGGMLGKMISSGLAPDPATGGVTLDSMWMGFTKVIRNSFTFDFESSNDIDDKYDWVVEQLTAIKQGALDGTGYGNSDPFLTPEQQAEMVNAVNDALASDGYIGSAQNNVAGHWSDWYTIRDIPVGTLSEDDALALNRIMYNEYGKSDIYDDETFSKNRAAMEEQGGVIVTSYGSLSDEDAKKLTELTGEAYEAGQKIKQGDLKALQEQYPELTVYQQRYLSEEDAQKLSEATGESYKAGKVIDKAVENAAEEYGIDLAPAWKSTRENGADLLNKSKYTYAAGQEFGYNDRLLAQEEVQKRIIAEQGKAVEWYNSEFATPYMGVKGAAKMLELTEGSEDYDEELAAPAGEETPRAQTVTRAGGAQDNEPLPFTDLEGEDEPTTEAIPGPGSSPDSAIVPEQAPQEGLQATKTGFEPEQEQTPVYEEPARETPLNEPETQAVETPARAEQTVAQPAAPSVQTQQTAPQATAADYREQLPKAFYEDYDTGKTYISTAERLAQTYPNYDRQLTPNVDYTFTDKGVSYDVEAYESKYPGIAEQYEQWYKEAYESRASKIYTEDFWDRYESADADTQAQMLKDAKNVQKNARDAVQRKFHKWADEHPLD